MTRFNRNRKFCRWCSKQYYAEQPHDRDGFCSKRCKQAHHRALKKYVTATDGPVKDRKKS